MGAKFVDTLDALVRFSQRKRIIENALRQPPCLGMTTGMYGRRLWLTESDKAKTSK